jgi:hypothetical protein
MITGAKCLFSQHRMIWMVCIALNLFGFKISRMTLGAPAQHCFFKERVGIACPACGGSHTIQSIWQGKWLSAATYNPFVMALYLWVHAFLFAMVYHCIFNARKEQAPLFSKFKGTIQNEHRYVVVILFILGWVYITLKYN